MGADLEDVLESNRGVGELGLEHHHDVVVVLRDLFRPAGGVEVRASEGLECCDLLVEVGDILLDDVGELLRRAMGVSSGSTGRRRTNAR
mgnify:CR=1 FL=1